MRVVLDTNVLVSGLLGPEGNCGQILREARAGRLEPVYSAEIMAEYLTVLSRPKLGLDAVDVDQLLEQIERDGLLVSPAPMAPLKDASDTKFLAAAISAGAGTLITGNLKDFPRSPHKGVKIVGPAGFLAAWEV
jgi:putative PIN family toxin of toxin-antitoxin system